jgi:hypothetical protein
VGVFEQAANSNEISRARVMAGILDPLVKTLQPEEAAVRVDRS